MGKREVGKKYDILVGLSSLEKLTEFSEVRRKMINFENCVYVFNLIFMTELRESEIVFLQEFQNFRAGWGNFRGVKEMQEIVIKVFICGILQEM